MTPVTGRKALSHCPVGQLQGSRCHTPIRDTGGILWAVEKTPLILCNMEEREEREVNKIVSVKCLNIKS